MSENVFNLSLLLKDSISVPTTLGYSWYSFIRLKILCYYLPASSVADEDSDVIFLFLDFWQEEFFLGPWYSEVLLRCVTSVHFFLCLSCMINNLRIYDFSVWGFMTFFISGKPSAVTSVAMSLHPSFYHLFWIQLCLLSLCLIFFLFSISLTRCFILRNFLSSVFQFTMSLPSSIKSSYSAQLLSFFKL